MELIVTLTFYGAIDKMDNLILVLKLLAIFGTPAFLFIGVLSVWASKPEKEVSRRIKRRDRK